MRIKPLYNIKTHIVLDGKKWDLLKLPDYPTLYCEKVNAPGKEK